MAQQSLLELLNANKSNSKSAPAPVRPAAYSTQAQNSLLEQIQRYKQEKKQNSVLEIFKQAATQPNKTNSVPKPSTTGPVSIQAGPYATYHYNVSAQPAEQTYTPGQAIQQSDYQKQIQARQSKVKQLENAALQSLDFAEVLKGEGVNINPALRMTPLGTTTGDMENRYRHMTDEQQKVYDYYLKKGDQVTAAEYLNALESELDKAYGERIAQDTIAQKQFLKDSQQGYNETVGQNPVLKFFGDLVYGAANIGDDIAAGINTGADMAMQGAKQSLATAANILSGKDAPIVEDSAQQVADQLYTVQMGERSPVYGITTSVANMGVNALMGMAIPGSWAGSAAMGLTSAGNAYNQARKEGKTHEGAFAYGVLTGASETLLGKLLGGVKALGQTGAGKVLTKIPGMNKVWDITQKALNKVSDVPVLGKVLNTASKLFNTSEAFEEYLQSVLEPVFRNIALGESNEFSLTDPDALYEGLLGGITGGLMNLSYNWINRGYAAANQKINPAFTPQMAEEFASQVEQLQQQTQSIVQGPAAPDTSGEPVQVGRATKIYHPYTGEIPQSTRQTPYPRGEISPQSLRSARDNIELAKMQAQNTGSNVRAVLKKIYNAIFDRTGGQRKIVVDGLAFEGVPYEVSLNKSAVKKVLSEKEITPEKLAVFDNIDDIINKADYVGSGEYAKTKKQGQTIRYDYFERPIVVDGKDYVVAFDVEVFPSQNNYRTHKIIEIDVHPVPPADPGPLPGARKQDTHLLKNSIPQNVQNSNKVINEINLRPQTAADPGPLPGAAVENTSLSNNSIPQNVQNSNRKETTLAQQRFADSSGIVNDIRLTDEDFQKLSNKGVNVFNKESARNLDAASGNDKVLRQKLREEIEEPFWKAKEQYTNDLVNLANDYYQRIVKELGIKKGSKESAAVQWYGEGERQIKRNGNLETVAYTLKDLQRDFPQKWQDIVRADQINREIYDSFIKRVNDSRMAIYPYAVENERQAVAKIAELENENQNLQAQIQESLENFAITKEAMGNSIQDKMFIYSNLKDKGTKRAVALLEQIRSLQNRYNSLDTLQNQKRNKLEERILQNQNRADLLQSQIENKDFLRNRRLEPRKDYYHHFKEMENGFGGLANILKTPSDIPAEMVGKSENFKPKTKFAGFLQERKGGEYTADSVEGMIRYMQAALYAEHIDPLIARNRVVLQRMAKATNRTRNANTFLKWMTEWTNSLAGKSNPIDRLVLGEKRTAIRAVDWLSRRARANAVLGNISSAVSQFFNLPNAWAYIQNPVDWAKGAKTTLQSVWSQNSKDFFEQSPFLKERYGVEDAISRFDEGILQQPKKFAAWLMGFGDETASRMIWASAYEQAQRTGQTNPVQYADDITRRSVAGRGIGELPISQQSKALQLFTPFQVEVNNTWQLMKEQSKNGFKGARGLLLMFIASYLANGIAESLTGRRISIDPIDAIKSAIEGRDDDESWVETVKNAATNLTGEIASSIPMISALAPLTLGDEASPLFGENDPTRFGTGNIGITAFLQPVIDAIQGKKPDMAEFALNFVTPWGGRQIQRGLEAAENLGWIPGQAQETGIPGSYTDDGKLRFPVDSENISDVAKMFLFGQWATDEGQTYLEQGRKPMSDNRLKGWQTSAKWIPIEEYAQILGSVKMTDKKEVVIQNIMDLGYSRVDAERAYDMAHYRDK